MQTRQNRSMLLGRKDERLALDRLFAQAREGRSGVLALVGEPGIGKTALLEHAAASADAMRILRARGVESEAVIPFAGLAELLRPVLGALDRIPPPQATALAGALALGPARARDRLAIGAATLSLLSASAETRPLALLVDDAHWLDRSSAETLLFAARRLLADPVALVLTVREGQPSLLDGADLRTLRIAGLDRADAAELLARADIPDSALERLYRATGGNPLALLELAPETARLIALPTDAPVPISTSIATAFLRRFGGLPEPTRRVLVLAAASDPCGLAVLARAAASSGLDLGDLGAAEAAGLVTVGHDVVEFTHPLARAAMFAEASAPERREAHAALAAALPDRDLDRRAWHLAAASVGPDDRAADALAQAGARAHERSAYAVAAAAFARAATLCSIDDTRGQLLLAAAKAAWLAGDARRTVALLDDAQTPGVATVLAARIAHLRGEVAIRCGPVRDGYPLLVGAAAQIAEYDPESAVVMLAQAVQGCLYTGDTPAMLIAAERASALASGQASRRASFFAAMARGMALVADGQGEAGTASAREAVEILEEADELREDPKLLAWAALGPLWLREADTGRGLINRAFELARAHAALGVLPNLLHLLARDQATTDQWAAAEASYDEAIRLGRETGQRRRGRRLAGGARLAGGKTGARGRLPRARRRSDKDVGEARRRPLRRLGDPGARRPRARARPAGGGDRALPSPGGHAAFMRHRRRRSLAGAGARRGAPTPWPRCRRRRGGCRLRGTGERQGSTVGAGSRGPLSRAAGGRQASWNPVSKRRSRLHERTPDVFETARTRLAYGGRLRRARKRTLAREQLRAAAAIFEHLGAQPWAQQANAELAATGETARRRDVSTLDELTPQELRIARLLADGMTTKEAAAAIFVSPKTVEYHLGHVYQKLGINSRNELVAAVTARDLG